MTRGAERTGGAVDRVVMSVKEIRDKLYTILTGAGLSERDAYCVMESLVDAELSGIESHGLMRVKAYIDRLESGAASAAPEIRVEEKGAAARIDGGNGLGPVVMAKAVDTCARLAEQYGVGVAAVSRSNHFGAAAYYSRKLAAQGHIGFVASLAGPTMAPFGGMDLLLGTNPFSIAFPGKNQIFCADMASSAAAKGKIRIYAKNGEKIPIGWALDSQGNDTADPEAAIKGILLPVGGHKGYALAMAVDALCGLLSGAALSCESTSMFQGDRPANTGHFAAAVHIAHFLPEEEFAGRAQSWFDRIHKSAVRPGFDRILIPGEPETLKKEHAGGRIAVLSETAAELESCYQKYRERTS